MVPVQIDKLAGREPGGRNVEGLSPVWTIAPVSIGSAVARRRRPIGVPRRLCPASGYGRGVASYSIDGEPRDDTNGINGPW